jgi:RNA polymerase sigma-70 factor (ECF subfamily)
MSAKLAARCTPRPEEALLSDLRAGDPGAFEALVRSQGPRLLAVARRLLRNEDDARDALQDALLSAFRSLDGFAGEARLSTWLHRIVVNACLMKLRTRRRRPEEPLDDLLPGFLEDGHHAVHPAEWMEPVDAALEKRENREFVRACIDRLPERYRTVLVLRDIEELDTEQTARALGTSTAVVKLRLHRARQALRTLLEPRFRSPEAGPSPTSH